MVFEYCSDAGLIADELLWHKRQFRFDPNGFRQRGARPEIRAFT